MKKLLAGSAAIAVAALAFATPAHAGTTERVTAGDVIPVFEVGSCGEVEYNISGAVHWRLSYAVSGRDIKADLHANASDLVVNANGVDYHIVGALNANLKWPAESVSAGHLTVIANVKIVNALAPGESFGATAHVNEVVNANGEMTVNRIDVDIPSWTCSVPA